jgi:hypothetical protein
VVNFNVKFTSVFGGHSLINNTYYEIFLLLFPGNFSIVFRPSLSGVYDHWTAVLKSTLPVNLYGHFSVLLSCVGGGLWDSIV